VGALWECLAIGARTDLEIVRYACDRILYFTIDVIAESLIEPLMGHLSSIL